MNSANEKERDDIDFIFDEQGLLSNIKEDYAPRESQIEAAKEILHALHQRKHVILEGACGFGKTFAYLVPVFSVLSDDDNTKRAVIVTNGIALQEQLNYKDLPMIQRLFKTLTGNEVSFALLKGRSNFLCLNKMNNLLLDRSNEGKYSKDILDDYANGRLKSTDISTLDFVMDYKSASELTCLEEGECLGKKCGYYSECEYQTSRNKALTANVVVTNYHMLFSDLQTGGRVLGEYDMLAFDEAHEVANVYRDFLETKINYHVINGLRNKLIELGNRDKWIEERFILKSELMNCMNVAIKYFDAVQKSLFYDKDKNETLVLTSGSVLCAYEDEHKAMLKVMDYFLNLFNEIADAMSIKSGQEDEEDDDGEADKICYMALAAAERTNQIKVVLEDYPRILASSEEVLWVENLIDDKTGNANVTIRTKPVTVGRKLHESFFGFPDLSCILTSATLSVNNSFNYIKSLLGLDMCPEEQVVEYIGHSPFDLTNQELWYLPEDAQPGDSRHTKDFLSVMPRQVTDIIKATNGGALCLFTSYFNLNYAYERVSRSKDLKGLKIFKQGDAPRLTLTEMFNQDKNSSLFATKSYFTGIDVPGDSLRCVIIDKFPFPSPADPLMTKLQQIHGGQTFAKFFIPEMIIALKQAVGRGVRTVSDKCVVVILDGRMSTANYKATIFNSFPYEKTGTRSIEAVKEFIEKR